MKRTCGLWMSWALALCTSAALAQQGGVNQQQPGMQQRPGMQQPGMQQPGMQQPGMRQQNMPQQRTPAMNMQQQVKATLSDIQDTLGFVPVFLKQVPDVALPGAWQEMKSLELNPNTALPGKYKELIGLAVAAQVPCKYCTYAHTKFARANDASDAEVGEAVMVSAVMRDLSAFLEGSQVNYGQFANEVRGWVNYWNQQSAGRVPPPEPMNVTNAEAAMQDARQILGSVPQSLQMFPRGAVAGAWTEMRDVILNPQTAIPSKYKSLIGLAVAEQIPSSYCIEATRQFARAYGANQQEIEEAVAMGALTRHWSTYLNGVQFDENAFRRDVDRMERNERRQQVSSAQRPSRKATSASRKGGASSQSAAKAPQP